MTESERPHLAGIIEDRWNAVLGTALRQNGWQPLVRAHLGYAGGDFVRVLARIIYAPDGFEPATGDRALLRRGWRNFFTAEAMGLRCLVTVGDDEHEVHTDRSGILDVRLPNPGLAVGLRPVTITPMADGSAGEQIEPTPAEVLVVDPDADFGIVSDIDDTVLRTLLPRPLIAGYNTFIAREEARLPVPGMATMYADLRTRHPGAPTFYVSTGAWNTAGTLRRFLARNDLPEGPMLLTDWGPTNTGWFRSGSEHKRGALAGLARDFPRIRWLLVGDDGQHDPENYDWFAAAHPGAVRAIAIRELGVTERVLTTRMPSLFGEAAPRAHAPVVHGRDGVELAAALRAVL